MDLINKKPMNSQNGFYKGQNWNNYQFPISEALYIEDPLQSEFGELLLAESIHLLNNIGVAGMNLHLLSERMGVSYEKVSYYFSDKYQLLAYLNEFYWNWMAHWISVYQLESNSQRHKLIISLQCLCHEYSPLRENQEPYIYPLFNVLVREPLKQEVFFSPNYFYSGMNQGYKKLLAIISESLEIICEEYPFADNLALTIIESVNQHWFVRQNMAECPKEDQIFLPRLSNFLIDLSFNVLLEFKD